MSLCGDTEGEYISRVQNIIWSKSKTHKGSNYSQDKVKIRLIFLILPVRTGLHIISMWECLRNTKKPSVCLCLVCLSGSMWLGRTL